MQYDLEKGDNGETVSNKYFFWLESLWWCDHHDALHLWKMFLLLCTLWQWQDEESTWSDNFIFGLFFIVLHCKGCAFVTVSENVNCCPDCAQTKVASASKQSESVFITLHHFLCTLIIEVWHIIIYYLSAEDARSNSDFFLVEQASVGRYYIIHA